VILFFDLALLRATSLAQTMQSCIISARQSQLHFRYIYGVFSTAYCGLIKQ